MIVEENEILTKRVEKFRNYIDTININETWKRKLTDKHFLGVQTQVYIYYPEFFWSALNGIDQKLEMLDKLCIAAYLYFISIILQDNLLDGECHSNTQNLPLISFLQEETIKILLEIFPKQHLFWKSWHRLREGYVASIHFEENLKSSISFLEYETFAINKSIYALAAIDSCYFNSKQLPEENTIYEQLIKSHKFFSVGFQLLDDFHDLGEDYKNKQFNIIIQNCLLNASKSNMSIDSVVELKKYFYLSGYAVEMLNKCDWYFDKALEAIKPYSHLELWKSLINSQRTKLLRMRTSIIIYLKEVYAKTYFSNKKVATTSLDESIKRSEYFIFKQQNADGSWNDMVTNQGISDTWVTSFISWNLSHNIANKNPKIDLAIDFLLKNKSQNLWGYNPNMIWDIDSSVNVLFALDQNNAVKESDITILIKSQMPNGAFSTYANEKELKKYLAGQFHDFSGWTHEHVCVSALVLYFLSVSMRKPESREKLLKYLLAKQTKGGLWESYWWTSSIYATTLVVKSLIIEENEKYEQVIIKAINALLKLMYNDFSFRGFNNEKSAFFTLLVLDMFCSSKKIFDMYKKYASGILNWVLKNQLEDGSFYSSNILRIPPPEIIDPHDVKKWLVGSSNGVSIVTNDFMRLFTTAVGYQALNKCNYILNK